MIVSLKVFTFVDLFFITIASVKNLGNENIIFFLYKCRYLFYLIAFVEFVSC